MTGTEFESVFNKASKVYRVYQVLCDRQWHCRECSYVHVGTTQIAGGAGIQGLQRGTKSRPGMVIDSANHYCVQCDKQTRQDRWTGNFVSAIPAPSMPADFALKAVNLLGSRDVIEQTQRPPNQLTVDHKLPMIRWNSETSVSQSNFNGMTEEEIRSKFQLLKASNGSVSHNLLKSRACERCFRTGRRGTPFGIVFFYEGGLTWNSEDKQDPQGCIGCGWYDFAVWRVRLNELIQSI